MNLRNTRSTRSGKREIRVREHGACVEDDFEQHDRYRRRAQQQYPGDLPDHGQPNLDGMEADRRRDIDVPVCMVNLMQPPQGRDLVRGEVLQPDGKVEHDHRQRHLQPHGQFDGIEQTPAVHGGEMRGGNGGQRHGQTAP